MQTTNPLARLLKVGPRPAGTGGEDRRRVDGNRTGGVQVDGNADRDTRVVVDGNRGA